MVEVRGACFLPHRHQLTTPAAAVSSAGSSQSQLPRPVFITQLSTVVREAAQPVLPTQPGVLSRAAACRHTLQHVLHNVSLMLPPAPHQQPLC